MCQVTSVVYPCCSRVYSLVKKISTCSEDWPKVKCPPDICLATPGDSGEAAHVIVYRDRGTCWRCQAEALGLNDGDREELRPAFDAAPLAESADIVTTTLQRRQRSEASGRCWWCNGQLGRCRCGMEGHSLRNPDCGCDEDGLTLRNHHRLATSIAPPPPPNNHSHRGEKRRHPTSANIPSKKPKMERSSLFRGSMMGGGTFSRSGNDKPSVYHAPYHFKHGSNVQGQQHSSSALYPAPNDGLSGMNMLNQPFGTSGFGHGLGCCSRNLPTVGYGSSYGYLHNHNHTHAENTEDPFSGSNWNAVNGEASILDSTLHPSQTPAHAGDRDMSDDVFRNLLDSYNNDPKTV
ncbi:hypothetical protein BJ878DRAFT_89589 [Calycina marina]|uniref:Uncharacterized protein n=1 Tax=Calycina marina TaxID=1763456 RepID=A0A9P7ZCX9_9HELO|nr:hypothetical protein BJ878DRAFT_89589 [Calycina marina]